HGAGQDHGGAPFHEIRLVVTDKAMLDFATSDHSMRLRSVHPGLSAEQVQALTAFPLVIPDDLAVTPEPTEAELEIIRNRLDPAGLRAREVGRPASRRTSHRPSPASEPRPARSASPQRGPCVLR